MASAVNGPERLAAEIDSLRSQVERVTRERDSALNRLQCVAEIVSDLVVRPEQGHDFPHAT